MRTTSGLRRQADVDEKELPDSLAHLAESEGEAPAVVEFVKDERRELSRADLRERAGCLAAGLRERDDKEEAGGPVVFFAPASTDAIVAVVGILRSGRVLVLIDTQMPDDDLQSVLENCQARLVVTTQRLSRRLKKLENGTDLQCFALDEGDAAPSWQELSADKPADPSAADLDDPALIFYTSGTTGPPKGVPLSHRNILFQLEAIAQSGMIRQDDRVLLPLPLHHVYAFVIGMLIPLAFRLPVILPEALTGAALARAMREGEATVTIGVPRLYQAFYKGIRDRVGKVPGGIRLIALGLALARIGQRVGLPLGRWLFRPIRRKVAPHLRLLASGGSPIDPDLARNLEAMGWPVAIGYGLTETAPLLTLKKPGEGSFASIGRAVEGVELRIDSEALQKEEKTGSPAGKDQDWGELLARGPNVFSGYHRLDAKNEEAFAEDGWFRTGDIARIDENGFVFLRGRISTRVALQGGENVNPEELEERYEKVAGIKEIGILEDEGKLAALVVPDDEFLSNRGAEDAAKAIRAGLKERGSELASYQRLARVEFSSRSLERTRLGKLRRHALQEAYQAAAQGEEGDEPKEKGPVAIEDLPSEDRALLDNDRARALWDLFCDRYANRRVDPEAHLETDLGIDSLEWVELSLLIEEATGTVVDDSIIGRVSRLRDLLEEVAEAPEDHEGGSRRPIEEPETVLDRKERHWAEPRGPLQLAAVAVIYFFLRIWMRAAFRVEARGLDNLPKDPFILASNHVSFLDAPAIAVAVGFRRAQDLFWAGRTNVMFRNVIIRAFSRLAQIVPIDPRRGPLASLAFVALVMERDRPLVWFPEGHISSDGSLLKFQPGIGLLLQHWDLPVVPVYIAGTHEALPLGRLWPRCRKIIVHFGKPLAARDLRGDKEKQEPAEIAATLRQAVAELEQEAR